MKSRFFVVVLLAAVIAVGIGACGGNDPKKSNAAEIVSIQSTALTPLTAWAPAGSSGNVFEAVYYKNDNVGSLSLTITVSEKASVPPGPYTFSGDPATCNVTVTAEDGFTKNWTLRAIKHEETNRP